MTWNYEWHLGDEPDTKLSGGVCTMATDDGAESKTLMSVGAGVQYQHGNHFSFKVQQAWILNDTNLNPNNDRKLHFSGSVSY